MLNFGWSGSYSRSEIRTPNMYTPDHSGFALAEVCTLGELSLLYINKNKPGIIFSSILSVWRTWVLLRDVAHSTGAVNRLVRWGKTRQCLRPITARHKRYNTPLHALHSVYDLVCVRNITTCSVESAPVYICIKDVYRLHITRLIRNKALNGPHEVPRHPASKRHQ